MIPLTQRYLIYAFVCLVGCLSSLRPYALGLYLFKAGTCCYCTEAASGVSLVIAKYAVIRNASELQLLSHGIIFFRTGLPRLETRLIAYTLPFEWVTETCLQLTGDMTLDGWAQILDE